MKRGAGRFNQNAFNANNINARAALLSGAPGIGKTTTARLLAKQLGFEIVEKNASDLRNKTSILSSLNVMGNNMSLTSKGGVMPTVIIMDEVDGMTSDRGGSAALIQKIKTTKVPIICICNDRQHDKMRTLANHCYDLKFLKPRGGPILRRLTAICTKEGLTADLNSLESLVD